MPGVGIPSIARKVSRWFAEGYQSTRERCSKGIGYKLLSLLYIFVGAYQLYVFVSRAELGFALLGIGLVAFGAYLALCCYATPSRLARTVASSLYLSVLVLLSAASVLFVLRLAG